MSIDPGKRSLKIAKSSIALSIAILTYACTAGAQITAVSTPTTPRTAPPLGPTATLLPATATITPASSLPTAAPIPAISADEWSRGPENAQVTLVEYSDFQ